MLGHSPKCVSCGSHGVLQLYLIQLSATKLILNGCTAEGGAEACNGASFWQEHRLEIIAAIAIGSVKSEDFMF